MRIHTPELLDVLTGSFNRRLVVDVFHGTDRVLEDLPVTGWTFEGDLGGEIKHSGRGTIVYASESGESLVPEGTTGVLSPFRARLLMMLEVYTDQGFTERINLGWMQVTKVPSAFDTFAEVNGVRRVVSSVVEIVFESLDVLVARRGFRFPEQPKSLASCYNEIRLITGFPVSESVADKPIPALPTYEATQGGRLKAVQALAGALGGRAVVDPAGAFTVVPDKVGPVVGKLAIGPQGTVVDVGYEVDTDNVYNCVVGQFEDANRNPIYAVAEVTDGDLAVDGLFDEYTRYYSSDFVKTQTQANAAVKSVLAQSIGSQQYEVPVQCVINPLPELGDTVEVTGHVRPLKGRVVKYTLSDSALMNLVLEVHRDL